MVKLVMLEMVEDRPRGRPARRCCCNITDWCGCSLPEAVQLASEREKWRGALTSTPTWAMSSEERREERCTNIIRGNLRQTY